MKDNCLEQIDFAAVTNYPTSIKPHSSLITDEEKITFIAERFSEIMEALGLDLTDQSLAKTPLRVAKMYVNEIFSGLKFENFPPISMFEDRYQHQDNSGIVFVKVNFTSFCEHHFVPMVGTAYVAYVPNERLIGLSKIPRIVRYFARRPQLQERLTAQIADSLAHVLETEDVAVSVSAEHFCILSRGVEKEESRTITNILRGSFERNENRRKEFFDSINRCVSKS